MDARCILSFEGGKLIDEKNGVYEYEVDAAKTPVRQLLKDLSDIDGIKDVEINKSPIEQVIAGLYANWKLPRNLAAKEAPPDTLRRL
jgi:hypothetical protein